MPRAAKPCILPLPTDLARTHHTGAAISAIVHATGFEEAAVENVRAFPAFAGGFLIPPRP